MSDELMVVVEQREDAILLHRLISRALHLKADYYAGSGGASPATIARNLLAHEGGPVLVTIDANTTHPESVEEKWGIARYVVQMNAHDSTFHLHAFVPQLEVIFYEAPCVLRRHFGREVAGMELELGLLDSRRQLDRLLARAGTDREAFYRALEDEDLDDLLRGEQMKAFIAETEALMTRFAPLYAG